MEPILLDYYLVFGAVAQRLECLSVEEDVAGSNPVRPAIYTLFKTSLLLYDTD